MIQAAIPRSITSPWRKRGLVTLITSGLMLYLESALECFFSTVPFETVGYIPYTNENNRWQPKHCSFHRYMIRKGFFDQKKQLIEEKCGQENQ